MLMFLLPLSTADFNCVRSIDIGLIPEAFWPSSPPPTNAAVGSCSSYSACEGPGNYGCSTLLFDDAREANLWGPTDIEIVYTDTSDASTFQAYITDSRSGCVRVYNRSANKVGAYEPSVFGVCGSDSRNPATFKPTYIAADASQIGTHLVPKLFVAYTELGEVKYHDPGGTSGTSATLNAKDENNRCG